MLKFIASVALFTAGRFIGLFLALGLLYGLVALFGPAVGVIATLILLIALVFYIIFRPRD